MDARVETHGSRPTPAGQALDQDNVLGLGRDPWADDPGPIDEELRERCLEPAGLAPGHRVPAHEPELEPVGRRDDRPLGAAHVGHDGPRRQPRSERTAELAEELDRDRRRRREHEQVGAVDRRRELVRRAVDGAFRQCGPGPLRPAAPGHQLDALGHVQGGSGTSQRAGDGPADEPESDDRDPHAGDHRRLDRGRPAGLRRRGPATQAGR
jgi:hypothetical protein